MGALWCVDQGETTVQSPLTSTEQGVSSASSFPAKQAAQKRYTPSFPHKLLQTVGPPPAEAAEQVLKQPSGSVQALVSAARLEVVCFGRSEDPEARAPVTAARRTKKVILEYISGWRFGDVPDAFTYKLYALLDVRCGVL